MKRSIHISSPTQFKNVSCAPAFKSSSVEYERTLKACCGLK
ncbi:hypothetical protein [Helicobacter labetoulli]|nr:hypothetical protein [Helicobacter labetoulli]